jgi:hypothetical protein
MNSAPINRGPEDIRVSAVIISELELGNVQGHIFTAHFVERADNAALENRPKALDGLSVDCTDDVLPSGVINDAMRIFAVKPLVTTPLIRAKQADFVRDGFADEGGESIRIDVGNHARNHIALTADGAGDWSFAGPDAASSAAPAAFIPMPVFGQAANKSFIDLNNSAELIDVLHESGSDFVAHEPSSPIRSEAHIAIDLQSAHSLFAGEHEMDDAEPLPQRFVCILENRPGHMRKAVVSGARGALIAQPVPWHCAVPFDLHVATPRAGYAFRPTAAGEIGATSVFVGESFFPLGDGHLVDWLGLFGAGHIDSPSQQEPI